VVAALHRRVNDVKAAEDDGDSDTADAAAESDDSPTSSPREDGVVESAAALFAEVALWYHY
jgi:hypothetical protein